MLNVIVHVFFKEKYEPSYEMYGFEIIIEYPCLSWYVMSLLYMYVILAVIWERLRIHQLTLNCKLDSIVRCLDNYRTEVHSCTLELVYDCILWGYLGSFSVSFHLMNLSWAIEVHRCTLELVDLETFGYCSDMWVSGYMWTIRSSLTNPYL